VRRTQIYLDERLHRSVRRAAAQEGRSAAALIREATARYLDQREERQEDPIRALIGTAKGAPPDAAQEHDRYLYGRDR
jgi:metal-responsive CopG/Arc/MetJ family transcriptional regulator